MNSDVKPSIITIERESLKNLVKEVKETLSTDLLSTKNGKHRSFSIADLWKCQKNFRTALSMRKN